MRPLTYSFAGLLLCLSLLTGRPVGIDDILSLRAIQGMAISPHGAQIAFVVNEPQDTEHSKDPSNTELYVISSAGGAPHRLTENAGRDSDPQWAPDGSSIAFLSVGAGDSGPQIYTVSPSGSAPRRVTRHAMPVSSFAWAPDGSRIAFLATEPPSKELTERLRRGDDAVSLDSFDTGTNAPLQRLWMVQLSSGKTSLVPVGNYHLTQVSWSPDGSTLLVTLTDDANLDYEWTRSRLAVVPADGGEPKVYCATRGKLIRPGWLPDGRGISFLGASANGTEQAPSSLFICRGVGSVPQNLTKGKPFTVQGYQWLPDSKSAVISVVERNTRYLARLDSAGRLERVTSPPRVVSADLSMSRDGQRLVFAAETPQHPADLWTLAGSSLQQTTHLNPRLEKLEYGQSEEFDWKARDGWDITGVVIKPVGFRQGRRYPMIVQVHGGPESADLNGFQLSWAQLFAAHGYAVFLPNYRGSIGRGVDYTIANHGDRGGKDFLDILDGVDAVIARGIADPDRLAIGGWSYGGFMSSWAVTQTDRFKAAVVGVGITDWFSLMEMAPVPIWNAEAHFLVWPYDKPEAYWRFSPVLHVKKVKTPTLMLWGEQDPLVPLPQALAFFRGLRYYGVASELVVYPREGHGLREPLHRADAYRRVLEWYQRYLRR